ncbi:cell division protein FtsH [Candidatus Adlerbacteria bacterium RIFCSPHIGHO2_02_FULL_52_17]|uniref:ATP-dependent zinc metalloprotease FtsH n=1 Tax=Candidatus Adlerbacteria bacterium RIFCSPHIGHO2_02_FULL_52_17 TaxID=1797240 RepID=A0A1F4XQY3_9BACT|nr:MAG: cell division protein FtsH [Candidatus Adlerbacteria bacterium RIFCSPHIGHO2_02_FULL_52_17]
MAQPGNTPGGGKRPRQRTPHLPTRGMFPRKDSFWVNLLTSVALLLLLTTGYAYLNESNTKTTETIAISQLALDVSAGTVATIVVDGNNLAITYNDEAKTEKISKKEPDAALTETLTNYGVSKEALNKVSIDIKKQSAWQFWLAALAPFLAPLLLIAFFVWYLSRQVKGAGMQAFSFGQSKPRLTDPNDVASRVTFKDVAGAKEAKEELLEIVDFLKNPKKFLDIGARIPKGILLMGAPGTGKTLLARAVAGEAGVPFFSISGSEFVEMFVGVGASRVRDLFLTAKKAAPAIIFVDEIDAVGRVRGTGVGGGNDEREQTLNQILVEMDGFEPNEKVIVMAATNRPDVLDPALLRPGRFDRRVVIELPDRGDRLEILKIHARKKPLAEDVNIEVVAERTPGFSGADLYSLMNEAAILAARENRKSVAQYDLIRSIEKVMLGPERRSHVLNKKEKEITAYHEAGHALVASVLPYADPVHKISIISRGRAAGYTLKLPLEDKRMQSKREFLDDIAMSLGGYVAEKMVFGDVTTGPSNDLQVLTALARDMVARYGMSDKMGTVALEGEGGRALFGRGVEAHEYSEKVSAEIDAEVKKIVDEAYKKAEDIITKHRALLNTIAARLVDVETLEREEFEKILIANGITPKKKEEIVVEPKTVNF